MKKAIALVLSLLLLFMSNGAFAAHRYTLEEALALVNGEEIPEKYVASTEDFIYNFNFYGAFMADGHELSIENAFDFVSIGDGILFKTIFNDCEILSLVLTEDAKHVKRVSCTWARNARGADAYLSDFLQMLLEVLMSCDMEPESATGLFKMLGEGNTFGEGDTGSASMDGFIVSYEVTSYAGVSFVIEHE